MTSFNASRAHTLQVSNTHLPKSGPSSSSASSLSFSSTKSSFKIPVRLHPLPKKTLTNQNHALIQMSWEGPLSVKLIIQGKNIELSDSVRNHVEHKVGKAIQKHSHLVRGVDVRVSVSVGKCKLKRSEVTVFTKKHGVIRAVKDGETIVASVDTVCSVIKRQLRRIKEKDSDHGRHTKGFDRRKVWDPQTVLDQEEDIYDTCLESHFVTL